MSALLNIQEILQKTLSEIAALEKLTVSHREAASLLANMRSLEKRRRRLEAEFNEIAHKEERDICRYRLYTASPRVSLMAVSEAWRRFQSLFSVTYDAIKNGPKKRAKLGEAELTESTLDFAYVFPGSLGVVLTVPNERLLLFQTNLDRATEEVLAIAQAKSTQDILAHARVLGLASIKSAFDWATIHVEYGMGAGIDWQREAEVRASAIVQYEEFETLGRIIAETGETKEEEVTLSGQLDAADTVNKTFKMNIEGGAEIRGKFTDAISNVHTVELPKRYKALVRRTSEIQYSTGEEIVTYFLLKLTPASS